MCKTTTNNDNNVSTEPTKSLQYHKNNNANEKIISLSISSKIK